MGVSILRLVLSREAHLVEPITTIEAPSLRSYEPLTRCRSKQSVWRRQTARTIHSQEGESDVAVDLGLDGDLHLEVEVKTELQSFLRSNGTPGWSEWQRKWFLGQTCFTDTE